MASAKHKPKIKGKNVTGWWENIVYLCKGRDRMQANKEIKNEVERKI